MKRRARLQPVGRRRREEDGRVWSTFRAAPKPLPAESGRRKSESGARKDVRETAIARAGGRCQAAELWPEVRCWGPLDVDEIVSRGVRPGSHLEADLTQVLCRAHHEARHLYPAEARRRGLRRTSWEVR